MAEKSIAKSALEFLNNVFLERDPRNSILDPLTCIIRLGILGFKDSGTKVSVADNSIKFNHPTIFQGAKRWSMGDNREDLHNIYNPIKKVTSWFNLNAPEINGIIRYAIRGIHLLKSSYNQALVVFARHSPLPFSSLQRDVFPDLRLSMCLIEPALLHFGISGE